MLLRLTIITCLLSLSILFPPSHGNCFADPYSDPILSHAKNELGACDWYNGKNACPSCSGDIEKISLDQYQALHDGSVEFECGAPPSDCRDYLFKFLYYILISIFRIHCSPQIIQMVPPADDSSSTSNSSASAADEPQTTVCQYFSDRMWEKCHNWKVKDSSTGECVSLTKKFGNPMNYYQSISGGVTIWAPGMPHNNKITNCFNNAALVSPSSLFLLASFLIGVCW